MSDVDGAGGGNRPGILDSIKRDLIGVSDSTRVRLSRDGAKLEPVSFLGKVWSAVTFKRQDENLAARLALKTAFAEEKTKLGWDVPEAFASPNSTRKSLTARDIRFGRWQYHEINKHMTHPGTGAAALTEVKEDAEAPRKILKTAVGKFTAEGPEPAPAHATTDLKAAVGKNTREEPLLVKILQSKPQDVEMRDFKQYWLMGQGLANIAAVKPPENKEDLDVHGAKNAYRTIKHAAEDRFRSSSEAKTFKVALENFYEQMRARGAVTVIEAADVFFKLHKSELANAGWKDAAPPSPADKGAGGDEGLSDKVVDVSGSVKPRVSFAQNVEVTDYVKTDFEKGIETALEAAPDKESKAEFKRRRKREMNSVPDHGRAGKPSNPAKNPIFTYTESGLNKNTRSLDPALYDLKTEELREASSGNPDPEASRPVLSRERASWNLKPDGRVDDESLGERKVGEAQGNELRQKNRQAFKDVRSSHDYKGSTIGALLRIRFPGIAEGDVDVDSSVQSLDKQELSVKLQALNTYRNEISNTNDIMLGDVFSNPHVAAIFHEFADSNNGGGLPRLFEIAHKAIHANTDSSLEFSQCFDEVRQYLRGTSESLSISEADAQRWDVEDDGEKMKLLNALVAKIDAQVKVQVGLFNHFLRSN